MKDIGAAILFAQAVVRRGGIQKDEATRLARVSGGEQPVCRQGRNHERYAAVGEALTFLDQALDAGFRPGMGNVVPDRFFWALPPGEEGEGEPTDETTTTDDLPKGPRHVH